MNRPAEPPKTKFNLSLFQTTLLRQPRSGNRLHDKKRSAWWGVWELNESHLEDEELKTKIATIIENKFKGRLADAVLWEEFKEEVKAQAYQYSKMRADKAKEEKPLLTKNVRLLIEEENWTSGVFTQDIRDCKGRILGILESTEVLSSVAKLQPLRERKNWRRNVQNEGTAARLSK